MLLLTCFALISSVSQVESQTYPLLNQKIKKCLTKQCDFYDVISAFEEFSKDSLKKFYDPSIIKTNLIPPKYINAGVVAEDFIKIANFPCIYYHSGYQKNANQQLCDEYGSTCLAKKWLEKTCECHKWQNKQISSGNYCTECHNNCQHGECVSTFGFTECQCEKAVASNGLVIKETNLPAFRDGDKFCDEKIDYCEDMSDRCDFMSTTCRNSLRGYECVCLEGLVPDFESPYRCIRDGRRRFISLSDAWNGVVNEIVREKIEPPTKSSEVFPSRAPIPVQQKLPLEASTDAQTVDSSETITEASTNIPSDASTMEAPTEHMIEAPTRTPTDAPNETPKVALTEASTEAPTQALTKAPKEVPKEISTKTPPNVPPAKPTNPLEASTDTQTVDSSETITEALTHIPSDASTTEAPTDYMIEAPTRTTTNAPNENPKVALAEASTEAPTQAPTKAPKEGPKEISTKTPPNVPPAKPTNPPTKISKKPTQTYNLKKLLSPDDTHRKLCKRKFSSKSNYYNVITNCFLRTNRKQTPLSSETRGPNRRRDRNQHNSRKRNKKRPNLAILCKKSCENLLYWKNYGSILKKRLLQDIHSEKQLGKNSDTTNNYATCRTNNLVFINYQNDSRICKIYKNKKDTTADGKRGVLRCMTWKDDPSVGYNNLGACYGK